VLSIFTGDYSSFVRKRGALCFVSLLCIYVDLSQYELFYENISMATLSDVRVGFVFEIALTDLYCDVVM
jgi:hypothetical protein